VDELSLLAKEMDALNTTQSSKLSERMRLTDANIKELNELWEMLVPVFDAAKGMYKGVDEVKLKDYTISHLVKRVHTVSSNKTTATKTEGGSN
jgi:oligoribonuclease (3'-5' exoribonuclease)